MFKFIHTYLFSLVLSTSLLVGAEQRTLTVGVEDIHFLPFSDYQKGKYTGIFKDTLEEFAKQHNYKLKWEPLPLNRLYAKFYSGSLDLKVPANEYWQKDKKEKLKLSITYSKPIVNFIDGVMLKSSLKGKGLNLLKNLGVVAGFTPWKYLGEIESGKIKVKENNSINGILSQGILGRVNGVYINIDVGEYYLNRNPKMKGKLVFDSDLPHIESSFHLASLKENESIVKEFDEFILNNPVKVNIKSERK